MRQRTLSQLRILAAAVPLAAAVGIVYDLLHGWPLLVAVTGGGVIGAIICTVMISVQVFGLTAGVRRRMRRLPAGLYVALAFASTVFLVLAAIQLGALSSRWLAGRPVQDPLDLSGIVFSLAVSAVFVAGTSLDRMVGADVLLGIFTGRYLTPREERRVFLFADLVGSTALAERIGDLAFHRYLDDLFCELAEPVARHRGAIYRYVGDEMIVTWTVRDGGRGTARALACVRDCQATLERQAARFARSYASAPRMRFVLHAGSVVTGKMGDLKREIVFLGDTVNTTARLEEIAKATGHDVVASAEALAGTELPAGLTARPLSHLTIRGKHRPVRVFALVPAAAQAEADAAAAR